MSEHTPEVLAEGAEETRVKQGMDEFVGDVRHLRFVEDSHENWTCMHEFLDTHNLDAGNPEHLHFAYINLVRDGLLELLPLGEYVEPQPKPAPAPAPAPIPVQSPSQPNLVPARARTFVAYKNGRPLDAPNARRL